MYHQPCPVSHLCRLRSGGDTRRSCSGPLPSHVRVALRQGLGDFGNFYPSNSVHRASPRKDTGCGCAPRVETTGSCQLSHVAVSSIAEPLFKPHWLGAEAPHADKEAPVTLPRLATRDHIGVVVFPFSTCAHLFSPTCLNIKKRQKKRGGACDPPKIGH